MRDGGYETGPIYQSRDRETLRPVFSSSYGKGSCFQALKLLPELSQTPAFRQTMEAAGDQSNEQAIEKYLMSMT